MTNSFPIERLPTNGVKMSNLSESRPCGNREVSVSPCYHNMQRHFSDMYLAGILRTLFCQIDHLFRTACAFLQTFHYKN